MRIAINTGPLLPFPPAPAGAVERLSYDFARHFASRGHEVTLIGRDWAGLPRCETKDGVRLLRVKGYPASASISLNLLRDILYSRRVLRVMPAADIYSTNAFWLPLLLQFKRRSQGGAIVVNANRFPKGQYRLYSRVNAVVAVSTAVRDGITAQCPRLADRITVLPNPIDTNYFHPDSSLVRDPSLVLYTGRIQPQKGLHYLVQAARLLSSDFPGLRVRLVGEHRTALGGGGEAYLESLKGMAGELPLEMPGPVLDRTQLADELRRAGAYVCPSLDVQGEALPVAPMEAMACGCPVLVSSLACFRDFLTDRHNGMVFSLDGPTPVQSLADNLRILLSDQALSARLSSQAAQDLRLFDNTSVAERFLSFYSSLLDAPPITHAHTLA